MHFGSILFAFPSSANPCRRDLDDKQHGFILMFFKPPFLVLAIIRHGICVHCRLKLGKGKRELYAFKWASGPMHDEHC